MKDTAGMDVHSDDDEEDKATAVSDGSTVQEPQTLKEVLRLPGTIAEKPLESKEKKEIKREGPLLEVTWDGDEDPENPRNWPNWKKWYIYPLRGVL
jgi:hypothetical protein